MEISLKHEKELIIEFNGRLDTNTSMELEQRLASEEIKESKVIFDMAGTEYISSAGLRLLLSLKKKLEGAHKEFEVHNPNDVCMEVFKVTGFINVLKIA